MMKKYAIRVSIILMAIILVVACIQVGKLLMFSYASLWKYSVNYQEYADDFNVVKNYIEAEFSEEPDKWLSVSHSGSQGTRLFDPDTKKYLQVPIDISWSLETISKEGFPDKDANFDTIRIHEGRISFCIENGHYALVYSPNQKPLWVNSPTESCEIKVKSIGDGWYHVTKDPG